MLYTAGWYWKYALLNLVGWLLLFGILVLLTNYMATDAYPFDLSSCFSTPSTALVTVLFEKTNNQYSQTLLPNCETIAR